MNWIEAKTRCRLLVRVICHAGGLWALSLSCGRAGPQGDQSPAISIDQEVRRLAGTSAEREALWPGFDPLAFPLAVYDGQRTFLFRHPSPPEGFLPLAAASSTVVALEGRHEAVTANSNAEVGGVATATVILDPSRPTHPLGDLAAVAIHEAFHVYQRGRHPGWIANEADLFTYPTDSASLLSLRRLETEALRRALAAQDAATVRCWARRSLALRRERYTGMDSVFAAYERGTELNEGLATYVEMRAAGRRTAGLPPEEFGPTEVRRRAYATGSAIALLLDRLTPGWPVTFEADDDQLLDVALAEALGPGEVCAFGDAAVTAAQQRARADVTALTVERGRRLAAFEGRPGWRVVIEADSGKPLWLQGFDPLNVERVGAQRVLHTRLLQLGNAAGQLEALGTEALTDGSGEHPLFQGIHRVLLTGLAEPELRDVEGKVSLRAPGVTVEFSGAAITRSGETIIVRVGS